MLASHSTGKGDGALALGFYHFLNRLKWPRSYLGRLILVCAAASSIPLVLILGLASLVSGSSNASSGVLGGFGIDIFIAVVGAELVAIGLMLAALRSALKPLQLSIEALDAYRRNGRVPRLPAHYQDEPGQLMREISGTIASAESTYAELVRRAETDPLTDIANRRNLVRIGAESLRAAARSGDPLSVVVLDLDQFKNVNDTYGHAAGDAVLRMVAGVVERALRSGAAFARVGGEEFAVLLPDTALTDALAVAERLRHSISALAMPALDGATITASFGVTVAAADDTDIESVLHRADTALYDSKRAGRDRVAFRLAEDEDFEARHGVAQIPFAVVAAASVKPEAEWLID